jgi:hypothetical protein
VIRIFYSGLVMFIVRSGEMEFGTRNVGSIFVLLSGLWLKVTVVVAPVWLLLGLRGLGF